MFEKRIREVLQMMDVLFFEPSLAQKKVLEELQGLGDAFNENRTSEFHNSVELINSVFLFSFFHCKVSLLQEISFDVTI